MCSKTVSQVKFCGVGKALPIAHLMVCIFLERLLFLRGLSLCFEESHSVIDEMFSSAICIHTAVHIQKDAMTILIC